MVAPVAVDVTPVKLDVKADHSCNWRCCWGCKCIKEVKSPKSDSETTIEETTTKVKHVVHRHIGASPQTPLSKSPYEEEKYP